MGMSGSRFWTVHCIDGLVVWPAGAGTLPASASGQSGDNHVNSMSQLPLSGPLTGSNAVQYDIGPSNPSQHHSGSQAWALNEAV